MSLLTKEVKDIKILRGKYRERERETGRKREIGVEKEREREGGRERVITIMW